MKILHVATAAFLCGGCSSFSTIEGTWPRLKGQNISVAIDHFGYPDREQTILADRVFTWRTTAPKDGCVVKIGTAADGTIKRMEYDGSNIGCAFYAEALRKVP